MCVCSFDSPFLSLSCTLLTSLTCKRFMKLYVAPLWWPLLCPCRWGSSSSAWRTLQQHWLPSSGRNSLVATTLFYGVGKTHSRVTAGREQRSRSPPQIIARSVKTQTGNSVSDVMLQATREGFFYCHYGNKQIKGSERCSSYIEIHSKLSPSSANRTF